MTTMTNVISPEDLWGDPEQVEEQPVGYIIDIAAFEAVAMANKEGPILDEKTGEPVMVARMYYRSGKAEKTFDTDFSGIAGDGKKFSWFSKVGQFALSLEGKTVNGQEIELAKVQDQGSKINNQIAMLNQSFSGLRVRLGDFEDYTPVVHGKEGRNTFPKIRLVTEVLGRLSDEERRRLLEQTKVYIANGRKNV